MAGADDGDQPDRPREVLLAESADLALYQLKVLEAMMGETRRTAQTFLATAPDHDRKLALWLIRIAARAVRSARARIEAGPAK